MTPPAPRLTASYEAPAAGFPAVSGLLLGQLADSFPPAVAIRVCTSERLVYAAAGGWARLADAGFPEPVPADAETLFDLASLTKVVATLPLVLLLHQRGRWSIDDAIARWLPGASRSPVTISQCLLHVAGLVPHRPYYATCADPAEIRRAVTAELADAVPGQVSYSDLGFMLLGWAVEECAGEPLEELASREILGPLGMTSTGYRPRVPPRRIAATEADGDQRTGSGVVWGSVHDGNAFALGEVSGHAGLFGTAADLGQFASALLVPDRHPVLSAKTLELMTARRAGAGAEARVLGWRLRPEAWGDWPDGTIWHTGFTGTSLLIAPALDVAVVLLSNAVHPVRRLDQIGAFRAGVHRAVRDAVGLSGNGGRALAPRRAVGRLLESPQVPRGNRQSLACDACMGHVCHKPRLLGVVCHKPQTPAPIVWGTCATSPVYRGMWSTSPERPRRRGVRAALDWPLRTAGGYTAVSARGGCGAGRR